MGRKSHTHDSTVQPFLGVVVDGCAQVLKITSRPAPIATMLLVNSARLSVDLRKGFLPPPIVQARDPLVETSLIPLMLTPVVHEDGQDIRDSYRFDILLLSLRQVFLCQILISSRSVSMRSAGLVILRCSSVTIRNNDQHAAYAGCLPITQFVGTANQAYGNGIVDHPTSELLLQRPGINPDEWTVSIEHEGFAVNDFTEAQYATTTKLVKYLHDKWNIPLDSTHVIRHREINGGKTCPGIVDVERIIRGARKL